MDLAARHAIGLWLLLALFCFRVAAQLLVAVFPAISYLPAFDVWASGALPYPGLVASQLLIIVAYASVAWRIGTGRSSPRPVVGKVLLGFGGMYFALMLGRLLLGSTVSRGHWWLDKPLPSVFHLVLSSFLLVAAQFHLGGGPSAPNRQIDE